VTVDIFRDKGVVSCTVTVESGRVQEAFQQAYAEEARNIKVPGFRRGKAPTNVVRSRVDAKRIRRRVLEVLVPEGVKECLERYGLKPMGRPSLADYALEEGTDFVFQISLVERPEVKLGNYKGLEMSVPELAEIGEQAKETLERLRGREARLVAKEGEVEEGDTVEAHLEYWVDGECRMMRERAQLDLTEPSLNAALKQGLLSGKVGDEKELEETPAEGASAPAGRYKVAIKAIYRKDLPELTPSFVRTRFGKESVEALLQEIEEQLATRARGEAEREAKAALLRQVCSEAETEVPAYSTIRLASSRLSSFVEELRKSGFSLGEKETVGAGSVEQVFKDILEESRRAIKERLVVDEIAEREGIEVTEEEAAERLHQIRPDLEEDDPDHDALLGRIEADLLLNKVTDFLYANAVAKPQGQEPKE